METTTLARAAILAPLPAIALEPFTATAYFRTEDGRTSGEPPWIEAWSSPLQDALPGAFTWGSAHTVYATYGRLFVLAFAGFLCALVALHRTDVAGGRFGWAWPAAGAGYALLTAGVAGEYWTPWMDQSFLFLAVPGLLTVFLTSPFLGARMLRHRLGSRGAGWMIALTMPGMLATVALTGHLGFAVIYLATAWTLHARTLLHEPAQQREVVAA